MNTFLFWIAIVVVAFLVLTLAGHVVHWAFHQKWSGQFFRSHMAHHLTLYPATDYLSETYRDAGKDNTVFLFAFFAIPFFLIPIALYWYDVIPLSVFLVLIGEIVVIGWLHDYFHDSFHIRKHFLKRFAFFRWWTDVHYVHHIDMQKNFGIFFFGWDRLFGSFVRPSANQHILE